MTEERSVDDAGTTNGSPQQPSTPEEVEAEWKYRVSQKDKAHAAETKSLREQIAALSATSGSAQQQAQGSLSENEALRRQLAENQKALQQMDAQHRVEVRAIRFPASADVLDANALAAMDEAKLAGLEARLSAPAPRGLPIDPSTPARVQSGAPKPIEEKTSAELREDLRRMAPQIAEQWGRVSDD